MSVASAMKQSVRPIYDPWGLARQCVDWSTATLRQNGTEVLAYQKFLDKHSFFTHHGADISPQ